ncbi:UTP--glucose-1-phosphate uridylyltransferase GalU [Patescibacteria group bacterium]|jgi:UTP--glucose-1-phosphate uridylyltransferase|nr:UTP--glucose-1-phosphate uridylyltransferase GalU [Patescibacteria group bacterium]
MAAHAASSGKVKKAILPVAGLGTRFLPATKAQPKEMLPIVDKPVIQYLVEEAVQSGIEEVIFVTGRGKRAIEDHFDHAMELEYILDSKGKTAVKEQLRHIAELAHFAYVRQKEARGDGDALLQARHLLNGESVAVLFGDDIIDNPRRPALRQLLDVYEKYQAPVIALTTVPRKDVHLYGVVKAKKVAPGTFQILDIVEKPDGKDAPSNQVIVGKFVLTPVVFEELSTIPYKPGSEIKLTGDALRQYIQHGGMVYGYTIEGTRYDCGSKIGFLKAVVDFGLKHPEVKKEFKKYLKSLSV